MVSIANAFFRETTFEHRLFRTQAFVLLQSDFNLDKYCTLNSNSICPATLVQSPTRLALTRSHSQDPRQSHRWTTPRIGNVANRGRGQNIIVRLGVSISDQAPAQTFNFNDGTRRKKHGVKQLAKMFGDTAEALARTWAHVSDSNEISLLALRKPRTARTRGED